MTQHPAVAVRAVRRLSCLGRYHWDALLGYSQSPFPLKRGLTASPKILGAPGESSPRGASHWSVAWMASTLRGFKGGFGEFISAINALGVQVLLQLLRGCLFRLKPRVF